MKLWNVSQTGLRYQQVKMSPLPYLIHTSLPCQSPCWGRVIFDQKPVGSKDADYDSTERESDGRRKWENTQTPLPCAFPTPCLFKHATVRLIRLNPKWLPSLQLTIHWINIRWRNRLVASTLQRGNCSCQYLSGNYYGKYLYDEERKDRTRTQNLIRHTINWADTETQCIAVNFPPE